MRASIGLAGQYAAVDEQLTGRENLELVGRLTHHRRTVIAARVQEVRAQDEQDPMALLEPNEQAVARLLALGLTNEQIAERLGFRDKRTISRTNGQIYAAWGLDSSDTDEKVARTRAAIIVTQRRLITWDGAGAAYVQSARVDWVAWIP